jgi:hypothetical protein
MASKVDNSGKVSVFHIKVPLDLAFGHYEKLSSKQLKEHISDLLAEVRRRNGAT